MVTESKTPLAFSGEARYLPGLIQAAKGQLEER